MRPEPVKVLHVIDSGGMYGAEAMLLALTAEQKQMGLTPAILSIGTIGEAEKPIETEARARGISIQPLRMRKGLNLVGAFEIVRAARAGNFDILHSHGYKGNILLGLLPRRIRRLPVVATLHGWTGRPGWSRMAIYQWVDQYVLSRLDGIVVVNSAMLQIPSLRPGRIANLHVIDNGICIDRGGSPATTIDPGIAAFCKEGFIVGAVGRLAAEKGFDVLVEALVFLCGKYPDIRAVILGEGPDRALLEQQIKEAGLDGRIRLPGYCRNAADYMSCFDVVALSSRTEGLPMTLLEAMAAGVPVVATGVGGVSDVLGGGEYGAVVEPNSTTALENALERVHQAPELAMDKATRAEQRVRDKYSSLAMAVAYSRVYDSLPRAPGHAT